MLQSYLLVGAGGAVGAMSRFWLTSLVGRSWHGPFPLGTFAANVVGSLLMGVLIGLLAKFTPAWQPEARLLLGVGLLGGFTTFSAFSLDVVSVMERGAIGVAVFYAVMSVILSVAALFVGMALVRGHWF